MADDEKSISSSVTRTGSGTLRSRGTGDPKTSPGAVAIFTAEAGPPGPMLKRKYTQGVPAKSTKRKASGNSGQCGRAWRRKQRMHGGGQVSTEEKLLRAAQSAEALAARNAL